MCKLCFVEVWKPIPGYEDMYEVSSLGGVRSVTRKIKVGNRTSTYTGRPLNVTPTGRQRQYRKVTLSNYNKERKQRQVHQLMLEAFAGVRPEGYVARHLNDVGSDNRVCNLAWGTAKENRLDRIRNGLDHRVNMKHCERGHPFNPETTLYPHKNKPHVRRCKVCHYAYVKRYQRGGALEEHLRFYENKYL